jgi:REP element-mobilizing transposase RayT
MPFEPRKHHRRSIRVKDFDYSQPGFYCVTICIQNLDCTYGFGDIVAGHMHLNSRGQIAQRVWSSIPQRFPGTALDCFVFMPNHMHGILVRTAVGLPPEHTQPLPPIPSDHPHFALLSMRRSVMSRSPILGAVVRTFKAATTRLIRVNGTPGFAWQRDYYESIITCQEYLDTLRHYIVNNPAKWVDDSLHPRAR